MTVTASAPGKVVLSGEYAVLDGAPAVAMAVDRRAVASVSDNATNECRVVTEGFESSGDARYRIVEAVCGARPAGRDFTLDTAAFIVDGRKLGIGSSAALTVALVAALQQGRDIFQDALQAHRRFQRGAGSGVDVAAAVTGGLIEYCMQDCRVERLDWPDGLVVRVDSSRGRAIDETAFQGCDVAGKPVLVHTGWSTHWKTDQYKRGFFSLQIHSGSKGTVHFRNIKVKELD